MQKPFAFSAAAVAATAVFAFPATANAEPPKASKNVKLITALRLTADTAAGYDTWLRARENRDKKGHIKNMKFNWGTDYCDSSPDKPSGFNFKNACARHDFGYGNVKHLVGSASWRNTYRKKVDQAFRTDMLRVCAEQSRSKIHDCTDIAMKYYNAVRLLGGLT
ncbi:phospholipase A2 [Nonomuraea sp. NPDC050643]|uniref:phospholipase A2 n=1 Tax=Nonomuraea sp. NPDC050643 TaxID=3155660 RepID=UPI0033CD6046